MSDTHIKGKQGIIIGYNHIDSVGEYAPAIRIGYVLLQLGYVIVGGKLVPLVAGGGGGRSCGIRGRILMPRFCSSIPQHLGTSCLGSPVARYQKSGKEDAQCQGGTEVARYHRPFEVRSTNSTRRETYRQLAACSSARHSG